MSNSLILPSSWSSLANIYLSATTLLSEKSRGELAGCYLMSRWSWFILVRRAQFWKVQAQRWGSAQQVSSRLYLDTRCQSPMGSGDTTIPGILCLSICRSVVLPLPMLPSMEQTIFLIVCLYLIVVFQLVLIISIVMISERVVFKAPGKVLVAGGYGVLEQQNLGLTLAVNKYFYSVLSAIQGEGSSAGMVVSVKSKQIKGGWRYRYSPQQRQIQEIDKISNPFVENAVKYALVYCHSLGTKLQIQSIDIDILFDRGFLSEKDSISPSVKFIDYSSEATKTGLGSSACVTVVVVGGLLRLILGQADEHLVNCVSQVANMAAQNKIGSNFDISTAVYGSHLYKNVLPRQAFEVVSSKDFSALLKIDQEVSLLQKGHLLLGGKCWLLDLKKGSNTRAMVSGFTKQLALLPPGLVIQFYERSKRFVKEIYDCRSRGDVEQEIGKLKELNRAYRQFLQFYSRKTGVPVEPQQFKGFLDQICSLKEVVYAICPGSGGYDAIFILSRAADRGQTMRLEQAIKELSVKYGLDAQLADISIAQTKEPLGEKQLAEIGDYLQ